MNNNFKKIKNIITIFILIILLLWISILINNKILNENFYAWFIPLIMLVFAILVD